MNVSPGVQALSADETLAPNQFLFLSIIQAVAEFLADAGAPLTAEQQAALDGFRCSVREGVRS